MDQKKRESLFRAFAAHDKRFDGKIFVGVTTTGIYCRSVCAARMPKFENCIFFKSAAEAEQAGFRPCKTCRPELAPDDNSQDHDRIAHKTASYIEKNCSLNESMEKLRSNEHMEQSVINVIKTNNILDQCERTVAT